MNYALVDNFGIVRNIIVWDGHTAYEIPSGWVLRIATVDDKIGR